MQADQIPAEIVDLIAPLVHDGCVWTEGECRGDHPLACWQMTRERLAAAWPLITAHVVQHEGDGYHTHAELYRYRMLYNAHAAKAWADKGVAVKSWRHSDGELCFDGGWFVVVATLHPHGQVSNHYEAEHWDLFDVPEVERAPEWDGHTPAEAADRLAAALRTPDAGVGSGS